MRKLMAAAAVVLLSLSPAMAGDKVQVGRLSCDVAGGVGYLIGSSKDITCTFRPNSGASTSFSGTIQKFGLDLGVTERTQIEWLVFAAGNQITSHNAISGTYIGASAEASIGIGGGANWLIGGDNDSFMLQPWSLQGQTGFNVGLALTGLTLN